MTLSKDELAFILMNGPVKMANFEADRLAQQLKAPGGHLFKFAMMVRMGLGPKDAAALARELSEPRLGLRAARAVSGIAKTPCLA